MYGQFSSITIYIDQVRQHDGSCSETCHIIYAPVRKRCCIQIAYIFRTTFRNFYDRHADLVHIVDTSVSHMLNERFVHQL